MPRLVILRGPDKGRTFEVNDSSTLVGRDSPDLPLEDNTISREHAELFQDNGTWNIRDLNSANGTYLNGVKISGSLTLKEGDQIRCGTTVIVFGGSAGSGVAGELGAGSLRIDADGNLIESAIMTSVPSNEDSVILAGPEASNAVGDLRVLYALSGAISSIFDQQQLLEKVMDMVFDTLPAERGFILLEEEEGDELTPAVVRYRSEEHSGEIAVSHTIVNHCMEKQEGVLCSNAMRDPRFAKGKSVHDYAIHSALCVPISVRDRKIGVIYVDSTVATHTYVGDQLRLLTAMGLQTGMALENAHLYQAGVQAERLAAAGETVAYLSHGIKNILQGLQSAVDMVQLGLDKNKLDVAKKGWRILHRNMTNIQNLVLNMLAFSKARKPDLALTQLNQAVNDTVEMLTSQADEKGVALITDLDDALPAISVDAEGIQQVLLNLVLNGLDAVAGGTGVVTIKTEYEQETDEAILSVGDNGAGIEPAQLSNIFEAFHSSKGQAGTGLGLAVVKKIVGEHKGRVSVTSQPGEGTVFAVKIPAGQLRGPDSGGTAESTRKRWWLLGK